MAHPTHAEQLHLDKVRSLIAAGIGRSYHKRKLSDLAGSEKLCTWVYAGARDDITQGRGWTIVGKGIAAYDMMLLLARALHLSGIRSRVVSLAQLTKWISTDADRLEEAREAEALFVTDFVQAYGVGGSPLTVWQIAEVEDFLMTRTNDGKAFLPHAVSLDAPSWWSGGLLQRVATANRQLIVA